MLTDRSADSGLDEKIFSRAWMPLDLRSSLVLGDLHYGDVRVCGMVGEIRLAWNDLDAGRREAPTDPHDRTDSSR